MWHALSKPSTPLAITEIHVHAFYRYVCKESCLGEKEVMVPLLPPPQLHQDGASQETLELLGVGKGSSGGSYIGRGPLIK